MKYTIEIELSDKEIDFLKKYGHELYNDYAPFIQEEDVDTACNLSEKCVIELGYADTQYEGCIFITKIGLEILNKL